MVAHGMYYVPTLFVGEYVAEGRAAEGAKVWVDMIKIHEETFNRALKAGVKIAFGTDAGGFDWKINPAKEFPLMVKSGMTPAQALRSANMTAAELLGMQDKIGSVEAGKFADIVAVPGDPDERYAPIGKGQLRDEGRNGVREAVDPLSQDRHVRRCRTRHIARHPWVVIDLDGALVRHEPHLPVERQRRRMVRSAGVQPHSLRLVLPGQRKTVSQQARGPRLCRSSRA